MSTATLEPTHLLTARAAARALGIDRRTFAKAVSLGQVPPGVRVGDHLRWPWRSLVALAGRAENPNPTTTH